MSNPWPYPRGAEYQPLFEAAEQKHGLPPGLLASQAWQESRFRPEVIDGRAVSKPGAKGIMQLIPRYYINVDPRNPAQEIEAAAASMVEYHKRFGTWALALAAYNWGPTNLSRDMAAGDAGGLWPKETTDYVEDILGRCPAIDT